MIIQDVNVLTLLSIACYGIILVVVIVIYKAFRWPIQSFISKINPFEKHRHLKSLSERVEDLELAKFEQASKLKKLEGKLKKKKRRN